MTATASATTAPGHERRAIRRDLLCIAAAAALAFLPGLGAHDVWNPDEPRYAEVAREMLELGELLVPHLNYRIYDQKPPLFFWTVMAIGAVRGGVDAIAVRLPSALAAIGTLLLVYDIGRRLRNRRAGWLSAVALGSCVQVVWQARFGQIDMLLTFLVTLAVHYFVRGFLEDRPDLYRGFFAVAGLATLAKGPVGLLPPLLSILAFLLLAGRRDEIRRLRPISGLAIWLAIVAAWLVPAGLSAGREYFETMTWTQNVTRYTAQPGYLDIVGHLRPWYHYLVNVPAAFMPWTLFLPIALWSDLRSRASRRRVEVLLPLCWVAVTVVFFSLAPAKRTVYSLIMFPGLALIVGGYLDRAAAGAARSRAWMAGCTAAALAIFGTAACLTPGLLGDSPLAELGPVFARRAALATWILPLAAAAALVLATTRRPAAAALALGLGPTLLWGTAALTLLPAVDEVKSPRRLATEIERRIQPADAFAWFPRVYPQMLYHLRRRGDEVGTAAALAEWVATHPRPWVVTRGTDLDLVPRSLGLAICDDDESERPRQYLLLGRCAAGRPLPPVGESPGG